ncbi:type II toxin-antitoxin system RelE/ParE family toxin [Streptomyces sp. LN590]
MLAEFGPELGGPWADHLEGPVSELRLRLRDVAPRVAYWITPTRTVVLLTVFRKSRQHDPRAGSIGPCEPRKSVQARIMDR